jgi:hypothetical protein
MLSCLLCPCYPSPLLLQSCKLLDITQTTQLVGGNIGIGLGIFFGCLVAFFCLFIAYLKCNEEGSERRLGSGVFSTN